MKILVIGHTYIVPINRKKWQVIAELFPDVDIKVVFPTTWPAAIFQHKAEQDLDKYNLSNCSFTAIKAFNLGNEVLYGYNPVQLFELIKNFKPDIVHVEQGDKALSYFQSILTCKILGIKSKFIFFTWVNWRHKFSFKYRIIWKRVENFNIKKTDTVIVGNNDAMQILREDGFCKPIYVLPQLGVDIDIFKPCKNDTQQDLIKIGFVGRFVEEKGIFLLLAAFERLIHIYPNIRLFYLGDGPCKCGIESEIKAHNLKGRVEILKTVSHERVVQFMQSLDIFVLPSFDLPVWREQFGHVLIEAMACKVAVLGSDAGEIANVLRNGGCVFKQGDIDSFTRELERLILDKEYRMNVAEHGYQKAIKYYSCHAIARETYKIWTNTLKV